MGKITHVHGLKGEIFVSLFSSGADIPLIIKDQIVQIRKDKDLKLCFEALVQQARLHKGGMIVQLKGVDNREQAELFKKTFLFAPKRLFSSLKGEDIYLCEVLDFEVYDKKRGILGKIFAFSDNRAQDLLLVRNTEGTQVEIPFIKEFITHIDFESERVEVDLPLNWPGLEDEEKR